METFRRGWWGWIRSSEGYSVRLLGRSNLGYQDQDGTLHIPAEAMSKPWSNIVVQTDAIPDLPERPRAVLVDRLRRAFRFAGWVLIDPMETHSDEHR